MTDITMPRLSDSMEEGTILSWLKSDGETVERGEELVEIETDKATMTFESPEAGTLKILATEGTTLAVGEPIAQAGDAGAAPPQPPAAPEPEVEPEPVAQTVSAPPELARSPPSEAGGAGTNGAAPNGNGAAPANADVSATPLARRVAAHHGVDLSAVSGSGPRGRITRGDVISAGSLELPDAVPAPGGAAAPPPAAPAPAAPAPAAAAPSVASSAPAPGAVGAKGETSRQELTRIQQLIARRMAETKATVPEFQVETEANMNAVLELRSELKQTSERPPSVNDFVVKASALALREFPLANGSYKDDGFELHARVNVGVAVAAEGALVVPTVTDADSRSLGSISAEIRRLAGAVRDGSVTAPELSGATFTVSNLGMYGMTAINPVINSPQAAILGVGALRPTLARVDGEIIEKQLMSLTLSCDHRILYGADAAQFLSRIRELLEQPLLLAL